LKTHLLEPNLEVGVENGDERNGLLARSLSDVEEEGLVLGGEKLLLCGRVDSEEEVDEEDGIVEGRERLKDGLLDSSSVDSSEPLLDSSKPVSGKVPERDVDPPRLVSDVHESNHPLGDFLVCHLSDVGDDRSVALLSEPGLVEVLVESTDDVVLLGLEPGSSLLLGHVEDGVVELSPELDSSSGDLVDGFSELGSNGEDSSGLSIVGSLPLVVVDSGSVDDELLDGGRGLGFLSDHDSRGEEDSVEGHGLSLELIDGPISGEAAREGKESSQ